MYMCINYVHVDVYTFSLQTAIDSFYDNSGHDEVHENVPMEETRPPSPGPAIAGTIHPLASKPAGKRSESTTVGIIYLLRTILY